MPLDKDFSSNYVNKLLYDNKLSIQALADIIGCTKSYLGQVKIGRTPLSRKFYEAALMAFPEKQYIDDNKIEILSYENNVLSKCFLSRFSSFCDTYIFDKRIIYKNYPVDFSGSKFEIGVISNSLLSPIYSIGDFVILDTSVTSFESGNIYAFIYEDCFYIKEIRKNPTCCYAVDLLTRSDVFPISSACTIIGLVVRGIKL